MEGERANMPVVTIPKPGPGAEMSEPRPEGGLFPLVYAELRQLAAAKLAHEPAGHTLDATALVHEVYLRIGGGGPGDRSSFLRSAAVAMHASWSTMLAVNAQRPCLHAAVVRAPPDRD